MIHGIGTDIVAVSRLGEFYARHGERSLDKLLTLAEREEFARLPEAGQTRFLAKRFAAKEAFGKALAELPPGPRSHHARGERRRNVEQVARSVADAHRTLDRYGVH